MQFSIYFPNISTTYSDTSVCLHLIHSKVVFTSKFLLFQSLEIQMKWSKEQEILLVREVLAVNPFQHQKGTSERAKLWQDIASNLNTIQQKFTGNSLTLRSVRDHVNLVLIKKFKKKMSDEEKASGIAVEVTELDTALEEICARSEESDRDKDGLAKQRREKMEKEAKQIEDMRAKALEKVGQTKKRVFEDEEEEEKPKRRGRRSGGDTVTYLQEKSVKEFGLRQEELALKKDKKLI